MPRRIGAHISLATQLEDSGLVDQAQLHFRLAGELQETEPTDLLLRNKLMVPVLYDSTEHVASVRADLEAGLADLLHPNRSALRLDALNQVGMPGESVGRLASSTLLSSPGVDARKLLLGLPGPQ